MEILPVPSTHLIQSSPQVSIHANNNKLRNGHNFKACHRQASPLCSSIEPSKYVASRPWRKDKVVFVLGATGTGKSKLAIDLAAHFDGEVVNSDKMQVYAGLNIITNKVTEEECAGIPHHLIGGVHPDADFTASDFHREATKAVDHILARGHLPVIAGGSNSYIEELVDGDGGRFRWKYDCCFVWIAVDLPVLHSFVSDRVDKMVEMGLVEEARGMFDPAADYSRGIRKSIGIPEMDRYFRAEGEAVDEEAKSQLLKKAMDEIKENTCKLTFRQLQKIIRLSTLARWEIHKVDATEAFQERTEQVWNRVAREPSVKIVEKFLNRGDSGRRILKKLMNITEASGITSEATTFSVSAVEHDQLDKVPAHLH